MLTEEASDAVECGWKEDEEEAGLAVREISFDKDSSVWMKLACTFAKWDDRDRRAVESRWKNAVSESRGMTNS